jgi:hypothetical protein
MELKKRIELATKDTVGYSEASNKEIFMVGVSVALSKAEEHYERELTQLRNQVENLNSACNTYMTDLKNLATIVNRYSEND